MSEPSLTDAEQEALIVAFLEPDDSCAHNMVPVYNTVARMIAEAVDRERAAWVAKVEALESVVNAIDDEHYAEAPRYCNEGACRTCDHITRLNAGLLAVDDTEGKP